MSQGDSTECAPHRENAPFPLVYGTPAILLCVPDLHKTLARSYFALPFLLVAESLDIGQRFRNQLC